MRKTATIRLNEITSANIIGASFSLRFVNMGGHGYATVKVTSDAFETEFVCIPRPIERSTRADGGPIAYRALHRAKLWTKQEAPAIEQTILEGNAELCI